ncbi:DUF4403 family protein [Roseovarius sp. D22-M7]|uniref:DUF4403 family protein n=1 Tax=Roseovarius sp. D22-M7 TaxID=3127116 RepID=UPI00300F817D
MAGIAALRIFVVFGPDGPPPAENVAYEVERPVTSVQTRIRAALPALEKALHNEIVTGEPVYSGQLDRIPADLIRGLLGLPRRKEAGCDAKNMNAAVDGYNACLQAAARSAPSISLPVVKEIEKEVKKGACGVKFGFDSVDEATRALGACARDLVPVPLPSEKFNVTYDFFIADIDLAARDGMLEVEARIDSTLTAPASVLSYLDGKTTKACGPSLTATARLLSTLEADNMDRSRAIGKIDIGLSVGRVEISRGKPCRKLDGTVEKALDEAVGKGLAALSDVFQNALTGALADLPEDPVRAEAINASLAGIVKLLTEPIDLAPLIEAQKPGVLPPDVTPFLSLNPQRVRVAAPRIVKSNATGYLLVSPGIVAAPAVVFEQPGPPPQRFIEIETDAPPDDRFRVSMTGQIGLEAAQTIVTDQVRAVIDEKLDRIAYDDLDVTLYQARERLVIGVRVSGLTWLGLKAKVFLTARPDIDSDTREIRLREVKFDLASARFLSRIAAFVVEAPIEAAIEERVALPLGAGYDAVLAELADMSIELKRIAGSTATLTLSLSELALAHLWLSEGNLHAAVTASGRSRVAFE